MKLAMAACGSRAVCGGVAVLRAVFVLIFASPASAARTRPIQAMKQTDREHVNASIRHSAIAPSMYLQPGRDAVVSLHITGSAKPLSEQILRQPPIVNTSGEALDISTSLTVEGTQNLENASVLLPAKRNKTRVSQNKTQALIMDRTQGPAPMPALGSEPGPAPAPAPATGPEPAPEKNATSEPAQKPRPKKKYLPIGEGADQSAEAVAQRTTDTRKDCEEGKWADCYTKDGDYSDVHPLSDSKRKGGGLANEHGGVLDGSMPTFRHPYSGGMPSTPSLTNSMVVFAVLLVAYS